ncbi:ATPase RavA stimulator ViaA [Proteus hauseri]|uniref:ATPase RavA stimulator ViaA n=1 Tax=Proteus hauseri TaxID=183417 RepID=UPI0032DB4332
MLTLSTIDMLLAINEGQLIEEVIVALLASPQLAVFFEKHPRLKKALLKDIHQWKKSLQQRVKETVVPTMIADEFALYQQTQSLGNALFNQKTAQILIELNKLESSFTEEASQLCKNNAPFTAAQQALFIQRWRISLIFQVTTVHKMLFEQEQEQLLAELQERLALSGSLSNTFAENERAAGRLWDMSKGVLTKTPYDEKIVQRYSDFLDQQPELHKLASLLGRSKTAKSLPEESVIFEPITIVEKAPDTTPEQVNGIGLSDDILRLLPTELALLGVSEIEYEFYRKLIEKQLNTYRLQGDNWQERTVLRPVTHHHDEERPRGPFVVCIDTSGSMGGFNEQCAKAFGLALMKIALADNRSCHVMLFSTEIIHYQLSSPQGLQELIKFLNQTFRGGTDLSACMENVAEKLNSPKWKDADAVVISDFVAQRLPENLINKIKKSQQQQHNRFHAVTLSNYGKPSIMKIFDHIWRFDTGLKSRLLRRWRQ